MAEALQNWLSDHQNHEYKALPLIICWGIWIARNKAIFENKHVSIAHISLQCINIFSAFPQKSTSSSTPRITPPPTINSEVPWAFFDGAAQRSPSIGGAGGILHVSQSHSFSFSAGLGEATNNFSELMALYLLLLLALENNITHLNIYGDSLFVIQVMKGTHILHSYTLVPLLEEIKRLSARFTHITFSHVYKNHNQQADQLSKVGLDLDKGCWKVKEEGSNGPREFLHNPWANL
jgi:ribonuclease HI